MRGIRARESDEIFSNPHYHLQCTLIYRCWSGKSGQAHHFTSLVNGNPHTLSVHFYVHPSSQLRKEKEKKTPRESQRSPFIFHMALLFGWAPYLAKHIVT